jgi:hypothetical protein
MYNVYHYLTALMANLNYNFLCYTVSSPTGYFPYYQVSATFSKSNMNTKPCNLTLQSDVTHFHTYKQQAISVILLLEHNKPCQGVYICTCDCMTWKWNKN